jgi:hypothetical protein
MPASKKARAVGFNHVALEVGDIDAALASTVAFSTSNFEARAIQQRSSIWVTSSLRSRRAVHSRPTMAVTLGWSSMTRRPSARRWPTQASSLCQARFSISWTRGAIESRSSDTPTFNSPKHRMCCAVWA